jgi:hypothetical protein
MSKIVNIQNIDPQTFELQTYSFDDTSLISNFDIDNSFNPVSNYIEYFIYDLNGNILYSNEDGSFRGYSLLDNNLYIDPQVNLETQGYIEGQYNTVYNFLNPLLSSSINNRYYIDQISSDRTEIRLNTTQIPNINVVSSSLELQNQISQSVGVYKDFYLDFGSNQLIIANNVLLDNSITEDPTVLIKLYDPLPLEFDLKSECWVVEQIANSLAYNIELTEVFDPITEFIQLKGPNTNLALSDQINNSTDAVNYDSLKATTSVNNSSSLKYQLNSLLAEKGIEINIDYNDFNNFCNFSSAETRLENFYYKLSLIEQYSASSSYTQGNTNQYTSGSQTIWQAKINDIITNFDGYEYFLYFDSGSNSWPKSNSTPPYNNLSTNASASQAWLNTQLASAISYDSENNNNLILSIPEYLRDDPSNSQYELFVEMIGQYFDDIWVYIKDVTNKYNADNRLNYGVSKDLVAQILRDLGVKIYQNNFSVDNLYTAFLGLTDSGSLYNIPNITSTLPTPTGLEYINLIVTASNTASLVGTDDINKETYKRIYHNLPFLLKKKGSYEGLRALITTYGIPETILSISEYGGKDKNPNTWDYFKQIYNYNLITGSGTISTPWNLNPSWSVAVDSSNQTPSTLQFRFQTQGLPTSNIPYSQSLWQLSNIGALVLTYTGSGYTSGSYSGSIPSPYNQYAKLDYYPNKSVSLSNTASVYLPFFDGGWWSVMLTRTGSNYTLYAGNKIYQGFEGNTIGFIASGSTTLSSINWDTVGNSTFYSPVTINSQIYNSFTGSLQEIRYYTQPVSVDRFKDYVMNPQSIESNDSPNQLAFRASLGGELYTASLSIHPKVSGSWITTSSFAGGNNSWTSSLTPLFTSNTEYAYYDQPAVGIQNPITDKIKVVNSILPSGNTLSPYISIQQNPPVSQSYTRDIDYVEVAFSPQDEINVDIYDQLGYFNIGEFIGDPRLIPTREESYPPLDKLRDAYFEKYTSNYDEWDYIRLIKFFDNSLFKMLQDWVPARTSLAAGVVVKQHILERNKYPLPQVTQAQYYYTASIKQIPSQSDGMRIFQASSDYESFPIETMTGGDGGVITDTIKLIYSTSSFSLVNSATETFTVNLGSSGVYNVIADVYISGGDPITDNNLNLYNSNETGSNELIYNKTAISSPLYFTLNQTFNLTSGYLTFAQSSSQIPDPIVITNLKIYLDPSYYQPVETPFGVNTVLITNEFDYNGELEGTNLIVTDGDLNGGNPFLTVPTTPTNYTPTLYTSNTVSAGTFLLNTTIPGQGQIYLFYDTGSTLYAAE